MQKTEMTTAKGQKAQGAMSQRQTDPATGLTLPLSRSLGSQELRKHRAMVAVELEVMAKKMDRFGWDRDRGTMAHDRLLVDWMEALQDYPLAEVQAACRSWVLNNSRKMPNEGDIVTLISKARASHVKAYKAAQRPAPELERERITPELAAEITKSAGFFPKRFF